MNHLQYYYLIIQMNEMDTIINAQREEISQLKLAMNKKEEKYKTIIEYLQNIYIELLKTVITIKK